MFHRLDFQPEDERSKMKEKKYDAQIGERAKHIREVLGITRSEVADMLGVNPASITNYEHGKTPMRASTIRSLCGIYGVSATWLLGIEDTLHYKGEINGRKVEIIEESPSIEPPLRA